MKTIEVSDDTFALMSDLAERCEWSKEQVIKQALLDAVDLQNDIELCEVRKLMYTLDAASPPTA